MKSFLERLRKQNFAERMDGDYYAGLLEGKRVLRAMNYKDFREAFRLVRTCEDYCNRDGVRICLNGNLLFNDDYFGNYFSNEELCGWSFDFIENSKSLESASSRWFSGWSESIFNALHGLPTGLQDEVVRLYLAEKKRSK